MKPFLNQDLDKVQTEHLTMPAGVTELLIQLPTESSISVKTAGECIKMHNLIVAQRPRSMDSDTKVLIIVMEGITSIDGVRSMEPIKPFFVGSQRPGQCVADMFAQAPTEGDSPWLKSLTVQALKISCVCLLLGDDPQLIIPDVLADDQDKWNGADADVRQRLLDRAKRRGKVGWAIGRDVEVIPHWRRPHPFLAWTGKGRTIPKVVMRSGAIIHRNKVLEIPTGYGGEVEIEELRTRSQFHNDGRTPMVGVSNRSETAVSEMASSSGAC
jgi:hypothetical protein